MEKIRVLIAEDEAMTRELLARLIGMEADIEVVGQAANGQRRRCALPQPDAGRAPHRHPDAGNGRDRSDESTKKETPSVQVVVLTIHHDDANIFEAIKAGARGYILKEVRPSRRSPPSAPLLAAKRCCTPPSPAA